MESSLLWSIAVLALVVWSYRFCRARGHGTAALLSFVLPPPGITALYVWIVDEMRGPERLRRMAIARGADIRRWIPTYVDLGNVGDAGAPLLNYSFAVGSSTDLLFYSCDPGLYGARRIGDPFEYAREYIGSLARRRVRHVIVAPSAADRLRSSSRRAFWKDAAFNNTLGHALRIRHKSVSMAAIVALEVADSADAPARYVAFGIPDRADLHGSAMGFLGELLPEEIGRMLELGELVQEYSEAGEPDEHAQVNAEALARGLLALLGSSERPVVVSPSQLDGIATSVSAAELR